MEAETLKLRKVNCKLGLLSRPNGSALLSQGKTVVIAGVYGPVEVKSQRALVNKATIEAHYRPKTGIPSIREKLNELILRNICETSLALALYPRSTVIVVAQELQNFGSIISCAVNAACLALLHSGIDLKFLVASVTCAFDEDDNIHLDPDHLIMERAKSTVIFVFDSVDKNILASHTSGNVSLDQFKVALEVCRNGSEKIFDYYKTVIKNDIEKT